MDDVILYNFQPSLEDLLKQLHFEADSEQADIAEELLEEAVEIASPKTLLKVLPVTVNEQSISIGNVEITYPYVRKMLLGSDKVAVYINTCGVELEEWALKKESDPLEGYIADAIKLAYLYHQGKPFREKIKQDVFPDDGHLAALNPGSLEQWPISEQKKLFEMLGGEAEVKEKIGVTLAESFLMHPTKSTSGVYFLSEVEYENCELCPRLTCPNRRAKYKGE
ncbi:MAG: vitamin B12 dependent methionine synthase [Ruminococcaceae bacterium]|nr:vitamin B12 dependent methionine synthase [Oscillospiraceae bacterium]